MKAALVLVFCFCGLLAGLGALWLDPDVPTAVRPITWSPPVPLPPDFSTTGLPNVLHGPPVVSVAYVAVLDRPLFAADRRQPPPPPPPAPPPPPDPLANLTLLGVFSSESGGGIVARFGAKVQRVRVSELVGEWVVQGVKGREVTFKRGEETRTVFLAHNYGRRPPPAVAQAPAPGVPVDRATMQAQDMEAARERLRQRNELLRAAGLPLAKE